jgi:hypothetical protein
MNTTPVSAAPSGLADISQNVNLTQLLAELQRLLVQLESKAQ